MQALNARPRECIMQIRIPVGPELDDIEERLNDGLLLAGSP
jgi:hypothetical protein